MSAYDTIDAPVAGMIEGTQSRIISKRIGDSAGIPFGIPVFGYIGDSGLGTARDDNVHRYKNDSGIITFDADFEASNSIIITVNGTAVTAVVFDTDHDTTMALVVAQIEAEITGCNATSSGVNNRILTIDIDGTEMTVAEAITGGGSQPTGTVTYTTRMVFIGFTVFTQLEAAGRTELDGTVISAADAQYDYRDSANIMVDGEIYVVTSEAVDNLNQVYAITAAGATQGQCGDTVGSNVSLTGATFTETVAASGVAKVRVNK